MSDRDPAMRKKKKKKRRETQMDSAWIKADPETEPLSARSENLDVFTLSGNSDQIQDDSRKKKKKRKKKVKTEGYWEDAASVNLKVACDSIGPGLHGDDYKEEGEDVLEKKKKKMRRRRRHSIPEGTQIYEIPSGVIEDGGELHLKEELQDREGGPLSSSQTENHCHKHKKKKKHRALEQPPLEVVTAEEDPLLESSDTTKKTTDGGRCKKRKQKAKGSLLKLIKGEVEDRCWQFSGGKMANDEARQKRKRKLQDEPNESQFQESQGGMMDVQDKENTQSISVSETGKLVMPKKKRKKTKRKRLADAVEIIDFSESQASSHTMDVQESLTCAQDFQTLREKTAVDETRRKKRKRKAQDDLNADTIKDDEDKEQTQNMSNSESGRIVIPKKKKKKKKHRAVAETTEFPESQEPSSNTHAQESLLPHRAPQTSLEETAADEAKSKTRKRIAADSVNESLPKKSEVGTKDSQDEEQTDDITVSGTGELVIPKKKKKKRKKKKKKKLLVDDAESAEFSKSQVPSSSMNVQKTLSPEDASKTKRQTMKSSRSESSDDDDFDSARPTQKGTAGQDRNSNLKLSRKSNYERNHSDALPEESSQSSSSSPSKSGSPSKGETSAQRDPVKTHTENKNSSQAKPLYRTEDESDVTADKFVRKLVSQGKIKEDDIDWIKELPFHPVASLLKDAVPKEGVVLKKGRWNGLEDNILRENVHNFCKQHHIDDIKKAVRPHLYDNCMELRAFLQATGFLLKMCKGLMRMPYDIYIRSRKIMDDRNYKGNFTEEEVSEIKRLREMYGKKWSRIGKEIDRSGQSVFDWNRRLKEGRAYGRWTEKEKEQLKRAVMTVTKVEDGEALQQMVGIPWSKVHKLVPTRNLNQCVLQWKLSLCWQLGRRREHIWTSTDSVNLMESLYNLDINEESDIDWVELYKDFRDRSPSPGKLIHIWHVLKLRHVPNYNFMTFEEIMDELHQNVLPALRDRAEKQETRRMALEARIKSREFISDSEYSSDSDDEWFSTC